jgi:hypothetical protein
MRHRRHGKHTPSPKNLFPLLFDVWGGGRQRCERLSNLRELRIDRAHSIRRQKKTVSRALFLGFRLPTLDKIVVQWDARVTNPVGEAVCSCWDLSLTKGDHFCPSCEVVELKFDERPIGFFDWRGI